MSSVWLKGHKGPDVAAYQADLVALGYDLPKSTNWDGSLDGILGDETIGVTVAHIDANFCPRKGVASVYDITTIPEWVRLIVRDGAEAMLVATAPERNTGIARIGAWAGSSALRPSGWQTYLRTAKEAGLHEVSFMLNDNTAKTDWHLFAKPERIIDVVRAYRDEGIRICLTSWLRPEVEFIDRMFDAVFDLAVRSGAERVENDAEEPWTTSRYEPHADCIEHIRGRLKDRPVPYGVTYILYHHREKVGPLAKLADFNRSQAYATKRQTAKSLHPGRIIDTAYRMHVKRYGAGAASKLEPCIALYDRAGAGGMTATGALRADLSAIERNPNLNATSGWSLGWLRRSPVLQAELRRWRDQLDGRRAA